MRKQIFKNKIWLSIILCLMFMLPSVSVFSQHHGSHGGHGSYYGSYRGGSWGYHHPRGYHWYGGSWWLGDAIIEGLVIGATLSALPPSYRVVYVDRRPYYYDGVYYYQRSPYGYVVVADPTLAPIVVTQPVVVQPATVTTNIQPQGYPSDVTVINVPSAKGGFTPVQLTRCSGGYLGPQGEFYSGNPTIEQLKVLYGQ